MKTMASLLVLCLLFVSVAGGCRKTASSAATLSGKVIFKGEPLPGGQITFHPKGEGGPISTGIDDKGAYRVAIPFSGEATVTVSTANLKGKGDLTKIPGVDPAVLEEQNKKRLESIKSMPPEQQKLFLQSAGGTYTEIPSKYADPKTTPLSITIKGGSQTEDINLTN
jgi:hypothetical protein